MGQVGSLNLIWNCLDIGWDAVTDWSCFPFIHLFFLLWKGKKDIFLFFPLCYQSVPELLRWLGVLMDLYVTTAGSPGASMHSPPHICLGIWRYFRVIIAPFSRSFASLSQKNEVQSRDANGSIWRSHVCDGSVLKLPSARVSTERSAANVDEFQFPLMWWSIIQLPLMQRHITWFH